MWRLKMGLEYFNTLQVYGNNHKQFDKFLEKVNFQKSNDNLETHKILPRPEELIQKDSSGEFLSTKSGAYLISKYGSYDLIHSIKHNCSVGYDSKEIISKIPEIRNVYSYSTSHLPASLWLDEIARQYPDLKFVLYFYEPAVERAGYYRAQGDLISGYEHYTPPAPESLFSVRCSHEPHIQSKCLLETENEKKEVCFFNDLEIYGSDVKQLDEFIKIANNMDISLNQHTEKILPRPEELLMIDSGINFFSTQSAGYLISKYGSSDLIHSITRDRSIGRDAKTVFFEIPEIRNRYKFVTKNPSTRDLITHCASLFPGLKFTLSYFSCRNDYKNIFRAHGEICSLESYETIGSSRNCFGPIPCSLPLSESSSKGTGPQYDDIPI
jgi:hypothetical protein